MKRFLLLILICIVFAATACSKNGEEIMGNTQEEKEMKVLPGNKKTIYLAGGCFWGVEGYFQRIPGVVNT